MEDFGGFATLKSQGDYDNDENGNIQFRSFATWIEYFSHVQIYIE